MSPRDPAACEADADVSVFDSVAARGSAGPLLGGSTLGLPLLLSGCLGGSTAFPLLGANVARLGLVVEKLHLCDVLAVAGAGDVDGIR